jgi:hypothetical protein
MPGEIPHPTWIYRIIHVDSLDTCLRRRGLHAPRHVPQDGMAYRSIHRSDIQEGRRERPVPCGPGGTLSDYVPFYFGRRSVMLYQLKTGRVPGYSEGQESILYLVSSVQLVADAGASWVFSDGHGLKAYTQWYDDLAKLHEVDWNVVNADYWADTIEDPDRQRRKQAEFLVHRFCDWNLIHGIGVYSSGMEARVQDIMSGHPKEPHPPVKVLKKWYY